MYQRRGRFSTRKWRDHGRDLRCQPVSPAYVPITGEATWPFSTAPDDAMKARPRTS